MIKSALRKAIRPDGTRFYTTEQHAVAAVPHLSLIHIFLKVGFPRFFIPARVPLCIHSRTGTPLAVKYRFKMCIRDSRMGGAVPPIGVVVIRILYFSRACKKFLVFAQTVAFVLFVYKIC